MADLAEVCVSYARQTKDPTAIRLVGRFSEAMLRVVSLSAELAAGVLIPLRAGLELAPDLQRPFLEILVDYQAHLWPSPVPQPEERCREREFVRSLAERWGRDAKPLLRLLRATGDPAGIREAIDLDVHRDLSRCEAIDAESLGMMLVLAREIDLREVTLPGAAPHADPPQCPDPAEARRLCGTSTRGARGRA